MIQPAASLESTDRNCREMPVTAATYWTLAEAGETFAGILKRQRTVRHACEAETSMMLALQPGS